MLTTGRAKAKREGYEPESKKEKTRIKLEGL